ncbi:MAG: hypothetical protein LBH04_04535 [Tannerellaceae bacterium]|jgi:hypothetical protein|nr:hypothetical protein [Tannerellaceae bacterium]
MKNKILITAVLFLSNSISFLQAQVAGNDISVIQNGETLGSLAQQFAKPSDAYKPHVWWHWLGSNFSKEGMSKDIRAMKETGIGGVIIFNAPSWLDTQQNPWPRQTYRSIAYWDAFGHALAEAKKLNMKVGMHNSPGWSTTGGPWISPEQGMQAVAFSTTLVKGPQRIKLNLPNPKEKERELKAYFKDVATIAVPARKDVKTDQLLDITSYMKDDGYLEWQAPVGEWIIYRVGHYPTMKRSHPTPEDVADYALEADKMNIAITVKHWNNVLNPLKDRFEEYLGNTLNSIWIDSYEAGSQNWSPNFRSDFIHIKGYDPIRQLVMAYMRGDSILDEQNHGIKYPEKAAKETLYFLKDYTEVVNRLFLDCFQTGKEMINKAGLQFYWEPYCSWGDGPFELRQGASIADVPITEFWVHSREVAGGDIIAQAAAADNKRIVGAEAFTGMEATCKFNETPAMLKRPADMGFSFGVNLFFLHSWAHNPFDDKYQPGFSFAHYGTHFSRNQTWFEPGKAFFTYLARCQMMLQQGVFISRSDNVLHRRTPDAEIFFVRNTEAAQEKVLEFPVTDCHPELWNAYEGTITSTRQWKHDGNKTILTIKMEKDESIFVVFPLKKTLYAKMPEINVLAEKTIMLEGSWTVSFKPKTNEDCFIRVFPELTDFSLQNDTVIKYFSGTAIYEKSIPIQATDLNVNKRIIIDLGKLHDIAMLEINGKQAAILWNPPYRKDITEFITAGNNEIKIHITNTWVNRLIGDEQYPEDFEWTDKNNGLRAMKGFPEWFIKNENRPVKERKTFLPWYYYNKDSHLNPAGLIGPVRIIQQDIYSPLSD